jgi:rubrerythrin
MGKPLGYARPDMEDQLRGSKTWENLKEAFSGESQANRRYLYFAERARLEGYTEVAETFLETAEGETGHAHGHIDFMACVGDPATGCRIGTTQDNLRSAIEGEMHEYTDMYPGMARTAREEGFDEIAQWFETLAKAERSHARRFQEIHAKYFADESGHVKEPQDKPAVTGH